MFLRGLANHKKRRPCLESFEHLEQQRRVFSIRPIVERQCHEWLFGLETYDRPHYVAREASEPIPQRRFDAAGHSNCYRLQAGFETRIGNARDRRLRRLPRRAGDWLVDVCSRKKRSAALSGVM